MRNLTEVPQHRDTPPSCTCNRIQWKHHSSLVRPNAITVNLWDISLYYPNHSNRSYGDSLHICG